jgi:predicted nucleic acid-binding Zn ribbon protein
MADTEILGGILVSESQSQPQAIKYCAECGHAVPSDADFCPECGSLDFTDRKPERKKILRPLGLWIIFYAETAYMFISIFTLITLFPYYLYGYSSVTLYDQIIMSSVAVAIAVLGAISAALFIRKPMARYLIVAVGIINIFGFMGIFGQIYTFLPLYFIFNNILVFQHYFLGVIILNLILGISMITYVTRPRVKAYFNQFRKKVEMKKRE